MGGSSAPSSTSSTTMQKFDPGTTAARQQVFNLANQFIGQNTPDTFNGAISSDNSQIAALNAITTKGGKLNKDQSAQLASLQSDLTKQQGYADQWGKQQNLNSGYTDQINGRAESNNAQYQNASALADKMASGGFDTNFSPIANAANPNATTYDNTAGLNQADYTQSAGYNPAALAQSADYQNVSASQSNPYQDASAQFSDPYQAVTAKNSDISLADLNSARSNLGTLDPTSALSKLLSGEIDNPYLSSMNQKGIDQSMQGYNDMIQNLNQSVMPQIGSDAFAAGQYGGSRQGIAEGLALQQAERNARDLTQSNVDSGNQLLGNAYQNAQGNMLSTAQTLNDQAGSNAQFNATNRNQGGQFNAGADNQFSLANASNSMANSQYNAGLGTDMAKFNAGNSLNNSQFDTSQMNDITKFNASNDLANNQWNAGAANSLNLANAGNQLNSNQYDATSANNMAQYNTGQLNSGQLTNAQNDTSNQQYNYGQQQQNNQFNADLGFQNNTQQMTQSQQNMNNQMTGIQGAGAALSNYNAGQDAIYGQQNNLLNFDANRALDNIDLTRQSAGMATGGTTTTYGSNTNNLLGNILGAGAAGLGAYSLWG